MFHIVSIIKKTISISFCKECPPGHFGLDCKDNCSGHCINNEPCDHVSGVCPSGCQDGYTEARCNNSKIKNSWFHKYHAFFSF